MTTSIDGRLAQARRLYHHMVYGGEIKRRDVAYLVEALEMAQEDIESLTRQNCLLDVQLTDALEQLDRIDCAGSDE